MTNTPEPLLKQRSPTSGLLNGPDQSSNLWRSARRKSAPKKVRRPVVGRKNVPRRRSGRDRRQRNSGKTDFGPVVPEALANRTAVRIVRRIRGRFRWVSGSVARRSVGRCQRLFAVTVRTVVGVLVAQLVLISPRAAMLDNEADATMVVAPHMNPPGHVAE